MHKTKNLIVLSVLIAMAVLAFNVHAFAAGEWPDRPLDLSIPTSPGSGASVYTQTIAKLGGKYLGQPIDVLHKPAGNGSQMCSYLMRQPADGYSLGVYVGSMAGYMNLPGFGAEPTDFIYLMQMMKTLYTIYVHKDSQFKTIQDFIQYAKENPGKLDIGSNKIGSVHFVNVEKFAKAAGIKINHIPYKGAGGAMKDVMGKHLTAAVAQPFAVLPKKDLRMLVLFNEERLPELPDLPIPADLGLNYPFFHQRYGIMMKKGTPEDVQAKVKEAYKKVMKEKEFTDFAKQVGNTIQFKDTEEFTKLVLDTTADVKEMLKELKVIK